VTDEQRLHELTASRTAADRALLASALRYAREKHRGQKRVSGEEFVSHPLAVALTLAELNLDTPTLVAALLHDVVEDCAVAPAELEAAFGAEIAFLVAGVTKLNALNTGDKVAAMAGSLRKMLLAMGQDIRVILIKLADRRHNLTTIAPLPRAQQEKIARETLDLYAPLAHRLGMERLKNALQEMSFRVLAPEAYAMLERNVAAKESARAVQVLTLIAATDEMLRAAGLPARVSGRPKNLYSIHEKMQQQGIPFAQVYDLVGLRVITDNVPDCYAALGLIHQHWPPVPGRFKDYIARAKSNGYQSIHTTVMGGGGTVVEFQIRTAAMHRHAEEGVAAHWLYKETAAEPFDAMRQLAWYKRLLDSLGVAQDQQVLRAASEVLAGPEVMVFTPQGDVKELPVGSTPVDFAFTVHTEVGRSCVGARVNGKMVPLNHRLANGDIVEVLTQKGHQPSRDWLKFTVSPTARARIRRVLREQDEARARQTGRELLEKGGRHEGLKLERILGHERYAAALAECRVADTEALYQALAAGRVTARQFLQALAPPAARPVAPAPAAPARPRVPAGASAIVINGVCDPYSRLANCCHPLPGDEVFGYVTRGRGVSVHRADCRNAGLLRQEPGRIVAVGWQAQAEQRYRVRLVAHARDRSGLLAETLRALTDAGGVVVASHAEAHADGSASLQYDVEVRDSRQGQAMLAALRAIQGVADVRRR